MGTRTISTRFAIDGEAEYKAKIKSINAELALHKSELEKVQAQYKDSANSVAALEAKQGALGSQLETLGRKHAEQAAMADKAREAQRGYAEQAERLRRELEELGSSSSATAEEQKKLAQDLEAAEKNLDKAADAAMRYQRQVNQTERDQYKLGSELKKTKQYLDEARASADGCARSIDQYGREVKEAGEGAQELSGGAKGSAEAMQALASALAAAGVGAAVREVAQALKGCVDTFAAFEGQMSTVGAVSGASGQELGALADKAKQMGATTAFTAQEAGQALEYMAMAGWKTQDMLGGLEGIMALAAASGEELAAVSDIVTDALTAFGLSAADSGRFADVLAAASANSNTSVGLMGQTFQYAAPVAGALGYSIEDVALAVGLMANAGIKGEKAGTALRAALTSLSSPSEKAARRMEELGVSLTDSGGQMRPLSELLDILRERFSQLTAVQQAQYAADLAGKDAMSGLLAVVNASEQDYQKLTAAIGGCAGAAQEMAGIKLDNFEGQVTLLHSAADGLKLAIGEQLTPALGDLAQAGTDAMGWATGLVEAHPELVGAVTAVAIGMGTLAVGVTGVATASAIATPLVQALRDAITAHPVGMIATACVAAVAAIGSFAAILGSASGEAENFSQALRDSKAAYEELTAAMGKEQGDARAAAAAVAELMGAEHRSEVQKEQLAARVKALNELMPELGLVYDRAADSVNMTADAMERMVDNIGAQEEYEAQVERLNVLEDEREEIQRRLAQAQEELSAAYENGVGHAEAYERSSGAAGTQVRGLEGDVRRLTAELEANKAETAQLMESTGEYANGLGRLKADYDQAAAKVKDVRDQMEALQLAYAEAKAAAVDSLERQMGLFNELDGRAKQSAEELIALLSSQAQYVEDYGANLQKAMELGLDERMVEALSDGSERSAQILDAIVKDGGAHIDAFNAQFARLREGQDAVAGIMTEIEGNFKEKLGEMGETLDAAVGAFDHAEEMYETFQNNVQGGINGANDMLGKVEAVYRNMAQAGLRAYREVVQQKSPSKEYERTGRYDIQGLVQGAQEEMPALAEVYAQAARTAMESYQAQAERSRGALDNAMAAYKGLDGLAGAKNSAAELEYQVWERTAGKRVSEAERYARKLEMLKGQMAEQAAVVLQAQDAYETMAEQYGANSLESYRFQQELLREKLALLDLADAAEEAAAAKAEMERELFNKQVQLEWSATGPGRVEATAQAQGYMTPYEAARIGSLPIAGEGFSTAYRAAAEQALDRQRGHLAFGREEAAQGAGLEQRLGAIAAAAVNAAAGTAQGDGRPLVVNLMLPDETVVASHYLGSLAQYAQANGTPIINPGR